MDNLQKQMVEIRNCYAEKETEKALLVTARYMFKSHWLPKSQVVVRDYNDSGLMSVYVPIWLAKEKGLWGKWEGGKPVFPLRQSYEIEKAFEEQEKDVMREDARQSLLNILIPADAWKSRKETEEMYAHYTEEIENADMEEYAEWAMVSREHPFTPTPVMMKEVAEAVLEVYNQIERGNTDGHYVEDLIEEAIRYTTKQKFTAADWKQFRLPYILGLVKLDSRLI